MVKDLIKNLINNKKQENITTVERNSKNKEALANTSNNSSSQLLTNPEDKKSTGVNAGITDLKKRVGHARNNSDSDLVDAQSREEQQVEPVIELEENQGILTEKTIQEDPQEQSSTQAQVEQLPYGVPGSSNK